MILEIPRSFPRHYENRFAGPLNQLRLKRILRLVVPHPNSKVIKVLDLCCSSGIISQVLSQLCQTAGLDVKKQSLKGKKAETLIM
jgi:2-polyprenyl-3-methyl-5-hydroxy-6-metoxy-1,4-benzoquinol methylase